METLSLPKSQASENIQWKQLWSLAALYASIIIGWIAYSNYQPKLLVQFQFTDFAFLLTAAQAVILVITPPIAGKIGDRFRLEKGHRLPIISSGISFAAMVFMAVAFTLFSNPGEIFKWLLPVLIVLWLVSMSIFTSPALSTVELFTPVDKLPKAMAVLTIVANFIYAFEPVIVDIIDYIGAPLTFVAGGLVTLLSGYAMQKNSLGLFKQSGNREPSPDVQAKAKRSDYGFIFLLGIILGITTAVMFIYVPDLLSSKAPALFSEGNGKLGLVVMLVGSALISWPLSMFVNSQRMKQVFWSSALLVLVCMTGMFLMDSAIVVLASAILYTVAFTSLSVSSLPLAIDRAGFYDKVLCVGIFFSGVALPEGLIESLHAY
ncbi:MAG TPA: MFS transporter [Chryseosolibacter sp.]|nr:MFS transporter [Chryseosolibacter sp.]